MGRPILNGAMTLARAHAELTGTPSLTRAPSSTQPERAGRFGGTGALRIGLRLPRDLRFDQWVEIGRRVTVHADASLWWIGDWLVFGERRYGLRYKRAVALTGLDYQTLRNYATIARRFPLSRRRDALSFQHHAEVCALSDDEQDAWLDRAVAGGWSRNELRRRLRAARSAGGSPPPASLRLAVASEQLERWRRAAELSHTEFESWMVATLDAAANGLLPPEVS